MSQSPFSETDRVKALLDEGLAFHKTSRLPEAEQCYLAALEMEKNNARALTFLGTLHVQRGEYEKATTALRQSLCIDERQPQALNSLGNALRESGRFEDAVATYNRALALRSDLPGTYFDKALALQLAGSLNEAIASYDTAIALKPDYAEAHNNRGNVLIRLRRYDEALKSFEQAIGLKPSAQVFNNRGTALRALEHYPEAIESYDKAIALNANYAEAYSNRALAADLMGRHPEALTSYDKAIALGADHADVHLGRADALRSLKRYADAVGDYDRAIALRPDFAECHLNKGLALQEDGRLADALASYNQAIALKSDLAPAHNNMGNVLAALGRDDEALMSLKRALALKPDYAEAYNNRALTLYKLERREEALESYDEAIRLKPDYAEAYSNRAITLQILNRRAEALESYDKALALKPDFANAHYARANLLRDLRRYEDALSSYDKALALVPDRAEAHKDRGLAFMDISRYAEAWASFDRALECDPDLSYALGFRWAAKLALGDWTALQKEGDELRAAVRRGSRACLPLAGMTVPLTLDLQRKCAEIFVNCGFPAQPAPLVLQPFGKPRAEGRIRVAYVSADFRTHAVAFLTTGIFEQHDRNKFELFAISLGHDDGGNLRARMKSAFEHFIDVTEKDDVEVVALLREKQIDIAVDLAGFTKESRLGIFSFHPAPIQVNYLGYPGTMGANYFDYIIADKIVIPEDEQSHYSEKVVYLPDTFQCNDSKRPLDQVPSRSAVGLPAEGFVFCSFNNVAKILPPMFDVWMRLLSRVEESVLWLSAPCPAAIHNLKREAEARGVDSRRLVFAPFVNESAQHLARFSLADLFLDALPYNAHAGGSDALWAGVPIVTCSGSNFAGRVGASLLNAIGVPELVTRSLEEYEALALELACNPELLARLKAKLLRNRETHPLFNTVRFTRHLEAAYAGMMERYRKGEPPAAFAVEPIVDRICEYEARSP